MCEPLRFWNLGCPRNLLTSNVYRGSRHIFRAVLTHPVDLYWEPAVCQGWFQNLLTHESCRGTVILYVTRVWRGCRILSCFCLSAMGPWARHWLSLGHPVRTKNCKTKFESTRCSAVLLARARSCSALAVVSEGSAHRPGRFCILAESSRGNESNFPEPTDSGGCFLMFFVAMVCF